jgi:uncharacterized protein YdaU (DUF1376 family)
VKHGSDWYKREPAAYLGGVQGMTAKEHAVYSVTLDLIYAHGGAINNDPSWIAGWISDMGSAAVRKAIFSLAEKGKLIVSETEISQKRAKTEAKTKENVSETARENGKKGGKKSAEIRARTRENSDLGEADASSENQAEKIREDKIEEKGKPSSSLVAEDYQKYLKAHPRPVDSDAGEALFSELVASGVEPERIIAAARSYAETVRGWSSVGKVQQSDNFLDPERGKWESHTVKAVEKPSEEAVLAFYADVVLSKKRTAPSTVNSNMAGKLLAAGLVTENDLKAAGVAA